MHFDLLTPPPGHGCGLRANYYYPVDVFVIPFYLICNMTMFWKIILSFWPFHPRIGDGWVGVCGQNVCYHFAAFVIPFNSICNMTMFWKRWILTFWLHPLSPPKGSDPGLRSKITFDIFDIYCTSVCRRNCSKNINNWLSYCEISLFYLWLYLILITVMLIYKHLVIMAYI